MRKSTHGVDGTLTARAFNLFAGVVNVSSPRSEQGATLISHSWRIHGSDRSHLHSASGVGNKASERDKFRPDLLSCHADECSTIFRSSFPHSFSVLQLGITAARRRRRRRRRAAQDSPRISSYPEASVKFKNTRIPPRENARSHCEWVHAGTRHEMFRSSNVGSTSLSEIQLIRNCVR